MERNVLIDRLIKFCFEYGVIDKDVNEDKIKMIMYNNLDEEEFIENIINTIIAKTRKQNDIDVGEIIELLTELEKIRLELEYKDHSNITHT